ncbi:MAG: MlaD family protein [Chthoniobacteraceae bacterium]|jgi:phospholipid/cholesterol/gamma-HCH transport system substrate-binding protein
MSVANPNHEKALELKAGIFVLLGLVFIATMAFKFGRLGQGLFQQYYSISVTFPSADGLIKNSDVQLAGARIGYVADKPVITPGGSGVTLPLKIMEDVKIPKDATFEVGSSGLLGDKFVDITPKPDFDAARFNPSDPSEVLAPGEKVAGQPAGGLLGGLETKADAVFDELKVEIKKLTDVTDKINEGILSQQNQQNITDTFTYLKGTTQHFDVASKDLDATVLDAQSTINSAKVTLGTVNSAAGDVKSALGDAEKVMDAAQTFLVKAQSGNGPVATLLNDEKMSENLKALVANLRAHGILFYKNQNRADPPAADAPPTPGNTPEHQF